MLKTHQSGRNQTFPKPPQATQKLFLKTNIQPTTEGVDCFLYYAPMAAGTYNENAKFEPASCFDGNPTISDALELQTYCVKKFDYYVAQGCFDPVAQVGLL